DFLDIIAKCFGVSRKCTHSVGGKYLHSRRKICFPVVAYSNTPSVLSPWKRTNETFRDSGGTGKNVFPTAGMSLLLKSSVPFSAAPARRSYSRTTSSPSGEYS